MLLSTLAAGAYAQSMSVSPEVSNNGSYTLSYSLPYMPPQVSASFKLFQRIGNGSWTQVTGIATNSTSYSFSGMASGVYSYRLGVTVCQTGTSHSNPCSSSDQIVDPVMVTVVLTPSVPGSITVVPNHLEQSLAVSWPASTGPVVRYELQNNGANVYSGTVLSRSLTGVAIGQSQTLRVRACNTVNSISSCSDWRTAGAVTLQNHFNVPASNNTGTYSITYVSPPGTTTLQEQVGSQGTWTDVHTGNGTQTVSRTKVNGTYNYRLYHCPSSGGSCAHVGSVKTTVVSGVAPATPANLTIVPNTTTNTFSISWPSVSGATTYRLQHGSTILQNNSNLSFAFTNATPGTSYSFSVWACAGAVCSASARTASGLVVQVPATLGAVPNAANSSMAISWSAVNGATHYELQQNNVTVYSGTALTRAQASLIPGSTYTYSIRACNGTTVNQCSNWRTATQVIMPYPAPSVPGSISPILEHIEQRIVVSWTASTGQVARYELQNNGSQVYSGTALSYRLTNASIGQPQTLRVRACNSASLCSDWNTASPVTLADLNGKRLSVSPEISTNGSYTLSYSLPYIPPPASASFTLYQRIGSGSWAQVAGLAADSSSYSFSGITSGSYSYRIGVTVCQTGPSYTNQCSSSEQIIDPVTVTVVLTPSVPGSISVVPNHIEQSLAVSWPVSTGPVVRYELQNNGANVYSGTVLSRSLTGIAIGQSQTLRVRACNTVNSISSCSDWRTAGAVTLQNHFNVPASNNTGTYSITYVSPPGTTTLQEQVGSQGTWTDVHTGNGTQTVSRTKVNGTYNYRLYHCPSSGGSCAHVGSVKTMVVSGVAPVTPASISIVPNTATNSFEISWSEVAGATSYRLQRDATVLQNNSSRSFVFSSASPGINYTFSVWACAESVCSATPRTGSSLLVRAPVSIQVAPDIASRAMVVSWPEVSGATHYELQQNSLIVFTGAALGRTQGDLIPGNTYTYRVRACNGTTANQCSQWQPSTPVVLPYPAPSVPDAIAVIPNHLEQNIAVSWSASTGQVARYELQNNGTNVYSGTAVSYTLTGTAIGETQTLRVRACNNANLCSGWRSASPVTLADLGGRSLVVSPEVSGDGSYTLAYNLPFIPPPASASFTLYERIGSGSWTQVAGLSAGSTSYSFSNRAPGSYSYRIGLTVCQTGTSYSNPCSSSEQIIEPVTVSVLATPAMPDSVAIVPGPQDQSLVVSWPASAGAAIHYELQKNGVHVYGGGELSHTLINIPMSQLQTFRVRACNIANSCSNWRSNSITLYPLSVSPQTSTHGNHTLSYSLPVIAASASGSFTLYERIGSGIWTQVANLSPNSTSYSFAGRTPGSYSYRISLTVCQQGPSPNSGCYTREQFAGPVTAIVESTSSSSSLSNTVSSRSSSLAISSSSVSSISSVVPVFPPVGEPPAPPPADSGSVVPVGAVEGQFRVNESGGATYSIPIVVPAGTAGVAPSLAVTYNSLDGVGLVGQGANISGLGSIVRCRQTLLQDDAVEPIRWGEGDRFCFNGQRLMLVAGAYGAPDSIYKTEVDSYVQVTARAGSLGNPDYFEVEAKDGSLSIYGGTVNARLQATTATLAWALSRFADSVGNRIEYDYEGDRTDGHRIKSIYYAYPEPGTSNGHAAWVDFSYVERPDKSRSYIGDGQAINNTKLLSGIRSYNGSTIFRRYTFDYSGNSSFAIDGLSRLTSVEECMSESNSSCYPKTHLDWGAVSLGFHANPLWQNDLPSASQLKGYRFLDFDGDGRQDLVWVHSEGNKRYIRYASLDSRLSNDMSKKAFTNNSQYLTYTDVNDQKDAELILEVLDYNSDGRQDLAVCKPQAATYRSCHSWDLYLSRPQGDGTWRLSSDKVTLPFTASHVRFGDINADGLLDAVEIASDSVVIYTLQRSGAAVSSNQYYAFSGQTTLPLTGTPPLPPQNPQPYEPPVARALGVTEAVLADINGDGRLDIVMPVRFSKEPCPHYQNASCDWQRLELYTYINTGTAFAHDARYNLSALMSSPVSSPWPNLLKEIRLVPQDFNGDGFSDLAIRRVTDWVYILNSGAGYSTGGPLTPPVSSDNNADINLVDYNRDGYVDIIWHDKANQQLKWRQWNKDTGEFSDNHTTIASGKSATHGFSFADINGDGVADLIEQKYIGSSTVQLGIFSGNKGHTAAGRLNRITDGFGREISISYGTLADSAHYTTLQGANTNWPNNTNYCQYGSVHSPCMPLYSLDIPSFYSQVNRPFGTDFEADNPAPILELSGPVPVVTTVETSAPIPGLPNNLNRVAYYYHHARMQAGGRGYLGFEKLATVDELTGIRTETTYHQDWPLTGSPKTTVTKTAEGHTLSEASNTLSVEIDADNPRVYRVQVTATSESTYSLSNEGGAQGSLLQTTTTASTYDTYGNLTVSGQVVSGGNNTSTKTVTNTFSADPWEQRMGRLLTTTTATQLNSDPIITRTTAFEYYGRYDLWPGLLNKEIIEPGNNQQTVEYLYDNFGNQQQVSKTADAGSGVIQTRTSQVSYDTSGRYVATTTDGLGHITSKVVDHSRNAHGQPTEIVDVNGVSTHILYAIDGREYQRRASSGAWTHTNLVFCGGSVLCADGARYRIEQLVSGGGKTTEYRDRLERVIRTSTVLFDGRESHVDIEYDAASRISRQSLPYVEGETLYWAVYEYDLLGRVVRVIEPSGAITNNQYDGYLTTITNALQQTRTEEKNSLGHLVKVTDHLDGTVTYAYDALGNLTRATTSADGKTVNVRMCYDSLGRKIAMHDPDKGGFLGNATADCGTVAGNLSQPASGRLSGWWFYRYNDFGELIEQSDTKKQTSTMEYDVLGRLVARTDRFANQAVDAHTRWTYDRYLDEASAQLQTRRNLTAVVTSYGQINTDCSGNNYCQTYTYDNLSRVTDTVTWLPGQDTGYINSVTYDSIGRAYETRDVLNGLVAPASGTRTLYNVYGYAGEVIDLASGDVLQKTIRVNSRGQVAEEWRHNGGAGIVTYDYHPHTGLLVQQQALSAGLFPIQDVSYEWDLLGNLKSRRNQSANIGYTARKDLQESFCYDGLNRLLKSHRGTLAGSCNLSASQQDMEYDGLGNITRKTGVGTYSYSGKGPHAVTRTSGDTYTKGNETYTSSEETYIYDNNGNQSGGAGRSITYSSYDQPVAITKGATTTSFRYGPDRARWQRTDVKNSSTTTVTHYLGNVERIEVQGSGVVEWKRYIAGAVYTVRTTTSQSGGSTSYAVERTDKSYLYNDHLGSLDVVVDQVGNITHSASFDAWGQRRHAEDWNGDFVPSSLTLLNSTQPVTQRGFTGHEMLDETGLIHMNGRIFDPRLARFMQADPYIQAATHSQSYNRYSYTFNNPLNATDPSGYIAWVPILKAAAWVAGSYAAADYGRRNNIPWLGQMASIAGCMYGYCSAAAFGSTYGGTQNLGVAIIAGISAGALSGMDSTARVLMSGMLGGASSVMMGGEYGHGFISAGLGSLAAGSGEPSVGGLITSAVVGGTISEMTGGKFKNGAASAAFSYAMTWAASKYQPGGGVEEWGYEYNDSDDVDAAVEQLRGTIKQTPDGNLEINATVSSSGSKGGNASRTRLFKLLNGKTFETDGQSLTVNLTEHNGDGVGDIHAVGQDEMRNRTTLSSKFNKKMARSGQSGKMECQSGCAVKMNGQSWVYIGGSLGSGGALHEVFHTYGVRHRTSGLMRTSGKTLTSTDVDILGTLYFGGR